MANGERESRIRYPGSRIGGVIVRAENIADVAAIRAVNEAAFGGNDEARLVDALRESGGVIASIVGVGVDDDRIVGHALFSGVWIDGGGGSVTVASLAPMAVLPDTQRKGIGTALARAGIEMCRTAGYPAVIVVGHPEYYPRFGFTASAVAHLQSPYGGEAFMGLDLSAGFLSSVSGTVRYPAAFAEL